MCTSPNVSIRLGYKKDGTQIISLYRDQSQSLKDLYHKFGKDNVLLIPCGHCSECQLKHRQEWAVRCACESLDHKVSSFITLTYDDEHLRSLNREDPLKFIKALRNSGYTVRYFGCGERGSKNFRPHYHIIVFGYLPDDLLYDGDSASGQALYHSDFVEKLWKKGRCVVQIFSPEVAGYVAGYTSKKLGDDDSFQFQSTKPGIGFNYIFNHSDMIVKYGRIYGDFGISKKSSLPRYFKKVLENNGYSIVLDIIKEEAQKIAAIKEYSSIRVHGMTREEDFVFYGKRVADRKLERLVREL